MRNCDCANCKMTNKGNGYMPCLNIALKMPTVKPPKPEGHQILIKALERSLKRSKENAKACEWMNENNATFHGGWSKGYFDGKVAALEDILSELKGE